MDKSIFTKVICFIFLSVNCVKSQLINTDYKNNIDSAHSCIINQKYNEALNFYVRAFSFEISQDPVIYSETANLAAKLGHKELAFMFLNMAVEEGYCDYSYLNNNNYFPSFNDERFTILVDKVKVRDSIINILSFKLDTIFNRDQTIRKLIYEAYSKPDATSYIQAIRDSILKTDEINLSEVRQIIKEYGYLGYSLRTPSSKLAMFTILLHAPTDILEEYIDVIKNAIKKGELAIDSYAYIEDKILLKKTGFQKYGTQFNIEKDSIIMAPLADPEKVNYYRVNLGLNVLEDYIKGVRESFKQPSPE
jgi:hypothetical protein